MVTGQLKLQIDKIWNTFWTGGISNPLTVIEQFTYLLFIRRLDEMQLVKEKQAGNLKADQMTFINQIVMHLEKNGSIDAGMLFEPPFTDVNDQGLLGVFDEAASTRIIQLIERVNGNASVG